MPTSASPNTLARLRSTLPTLPEAERQVADWILQNADAVVRSSMAHIAAACQVSDTTVLRLCRSAGFRGFTDLKLSLARDVASPTQLIHDDIAADDEPPTVARKVFRTNIQALYDTLEMLDDQALIQAVQLLDRARQILLVGVGASAPIAISAYHKFFRLGLPCVWPADAHVQLMQAALLGPEDLVITISHTGETRDPLLILKEAKRHQARTMCLTSNPQSPLTRYADVVLLSVSEETRSDAIASRVAQITLLDALHVILSLQHLEQTIKTEKRILDAIVQKTY